MSERLDHLLDRLSASDAGFSAPGLEADVMRGVARAEGDRRTAARLAPLRVGAVGLALVIGVTAGGLAAARTVGGPARGGVLSAASSLAPSTLLAGTR